MNGMPTEVLFIYASLVALVYFATDRFNNNSPFAFSIPVAVLGFFAFSTRMSNQKRSLTGFSFFSIAAALYHWSVYPKRLELSALMLCGSHAIYLFSYYPSLRRIWIELAMFTTIIMSIFFCFTFADLFRSVPTLVGALCLSLSILSFSFIVSGSVWKHGSSFEYEERTAFVRFIGMFLLLICNTALVVNHFTKQTHTIVTYLNFTYYASQYLLFFANERAF